MDNRLHDEPSEVAVADGQVHVDGPDGVAVAFTADAAAETADRLFTAATTAKGQEVEILRVAEERQGNGLK